MFIYVAHFGVSHKHHVLCRLDMILGISGSKKADVYESKISLASRIVKIERQVSGRVRHIHLDTPTLVSKTLQMQRRDAI